MSAGRLLSRAQLETLSADFLGFPRHLTQNSGLWSVVDAWQMLDGLSGRERQALLDGAALRYAALSERGRTAVRRYIRSVSARPNGAPLDLELNARALPVLQLFLTGATRSARVLELRVGRAEPPIYAATLKADWKSATPKDERSGRLSYRKSMRNR